MRYIFFENVHATCLIKKKDLRQLINIKNNHSIKYEYKSHKMSILNMWQLFLQASGPIGGMGASEMSSVPYHSYFPLAGSVSLSLSPSLSLSRTCTQCRDIMLRTHVPHLRVAQTFQGLLL